MQLHCGGLSCLSKVSVQLHCGGPSCRSNVSVQLHCGGPSCHYELCPSGSFEHYLWKLHCAIYFLFILSPRDGLCYSFIFSSIPKGETALHVSSSKGQEQVVRLLLGKGANPNAQTLEDISATMDALRVHDGTEDNLMNASRQTPLHIAIANRHKDVVTAFMEHRGKGSKVKCHRLQIR